MSFSDRLSSRRLPKNTLSESTLTGSLRLPGVYAYRESTLTGSLRLPGASLADIGVVGERIRRGVGDLTIMEGEQIIKVTISLGGISHPELNVSHEEALIRHADTLLYRAKNSGKNKLELYSLNIG